jgi:glucose-1-phosphate thymidylyltransferase
MKALILAAGYATRLYPLTENFPKPLLTVGSTTILDRLVAQLESLSRVDGIHLVSNHRYHAHFVAWKRRREQKIPLDILDDGTMSNESRCGAIADIALALDHWKLNEDLLVCAADNIFRFSLAHFVEQFERAPGAWVCARYVEDLAVRRRTGIATLDNNKRVVDFHEKPQVPASCWSVPPVYYYPRAVLPLVSEYLAEGGNHDAPGNFIAWLCHKTAVNAYPISGDVLDIGSPESLAFARRELESCCAAAPVAEIC